MLPRSLSRREMIGLPTLRLPSRPRSSSFSLFFSSSTLPSDRSNKQTFNPQTPTHTHTHDDTSPSTRNIKVAKVQDLGLLLFQRKGKKLKLAVTFFQRHNPAHFSPTPLPPQSTGPATLSPVMPCECTKKMRKSNTELLRKKKRFHVISVFFSLLSLSPYSLFLSFSFEFSLFSSSSSQ